MKKFLAGVLCATLVFSLAISALAISGKMTIEVDPINVQVNGEVFQPTDVTGKEVPVFAYQGTTYAPLRALAEAYGLEVGYDAATNMATVTDPEAKPVTPAPDTTAKADYSDWSAEDEAAYQEFKGLWEISGRVEFYELLDENVEVYDLVAIEDMDIHTLSEKKTDAEKKGFLTRLLNELRVDLPKVQLRFFHNHDKDLNLALYYDSFF